MRIIIVAPDVTDTGLAASFRISVIIESLLRGGHSILLFTSNLPVKSDLTTNERLEVVHVVNNRQANFFNKGFSKLLGIPDPMVFWALKVFLLILNNRRQLKEIDFCLLSSPPHSLHIIGLLCKRILGISFFSDFRDDWMGSHRLNHLTKLHKYFSALVEKKVINEALAVFCAIPVVAKDFSQKFKENSDKIFVFTNGFKASFREKLLMENYGESYSTRTIVYCGGGYKGFVTKKINKLASEIQALGLSSYWQIVTAGPNIEVFPENRKVWKHYGLVSPERVEELMVKASVHLSLLPEEDLIDSRVIPLKMYSQVATKGSIIFIGNRGVTNEVFNNQPGVFFLTINEWNELMPFIVKNQNILTAKYERNVDEFDYLNIMSDMIKVIGGYFENSKFLSSKK